MQEKFTYTIPQNEYSLDQGAELEPQNPEVINVPYGQIDSREVGIARVAVYGSLPEVIVPPTPEQVMHAGIQSRSARIAIARSYLLDSEFTVSAELEDMLDMPKAA